MTLDQFVREINDELSQDCQIPFKIPSKSLMRTIRWAKKWFWKNVDTAVEETYVIVRKDQMTTEYFNAERKICLDERIISVFGVNRMNGSGLLGDFSLDRLNAQEVYRYGTNGAGGSADIEYYVARRIGFDWMNQLLSHQISYDYNINTHELMISGETPQYDIVLQCYRSIPDTALFEDEYFFRYVMAQVKINLGRIIGTITMKLVGNAEINYQDLKDEGMNR